MKSPKFPQLLLAAVACIFTAGIAQAADGIKVNGIAIPQSRLDYVFKNTGQPDTPEVRNRIKDE
ncbi:MAG: hypothetical protein ACK4N4_15740, partial [Burkholderiales bacterium]